MPLFRSVSRPYLGSLMRRGLVIVGVVGAMFRMEAASYYVNSRFGSDENTGTSQEAPWKSLANLGRSFAPGDRILFARGSAYSGGVIFKSSGTAAAAITIGSYAADAELIRATERKDLAPLLIKYGAGPAPAFTNPSWEVLDGNVFRVEGSYVVIEGLYFHDTANPPGSDRKNKNVQKMGAVHLALATNHNIVRGCEFFHTPVGIKVKGTDNLITRNHLHDASEMMARSWGPLAIMVVGARNEISWNRIENYGAYGGPYGSDGGVIELDGVDDHFSARDIHIHHNTSINNHGFLEIAARGVENITVAYNFSDDLDQFIGGGSMKGIRVLNNTVIRTREPDVDRFVFWTFDPDGTRYDIVRNNIFVTAKDIRVLGPFVKPVGHTRAFIGAQPRDHNLYYSAGNPDPIGVPPGEGDLVQDPLFVDAAHGNFRLRPDSPARGKGGATEYDKDLDGNPLSKDRAVSMGAWECSVLEQRR